MCLHCLIFWPWFFANQLRTLDLRDDHPNPRPGPQGMPSLATSSRFSSSCAERPIFHRPTFVARRLLGDPISRSPTFTLGLVTNNGSSSITLLFEVQQHFVRSHRGFCYSVGKGTSASSAAPGCVAAAEAGQRHGIKWSSPSPSLCREMVSICFLLRSSFPRLIVSSQVLFKLCRPPDFY